MSEQSIEIRSDQMVPVLINEFLSAQRAPVNIYVRIGGDRYVQILKAGDETHLDRLQQYQEKEVERLFVLKEDYKVLVDQDLSIGGILLKRADLENPRKIQVLNQMSKVVFDELGSMGFSPAVFAHAKVLTKSTIQMVEAKSGLGDLVQALGAAGDELVAHSIAVSAVSVMIAKQMGWVMAPTLEKLALGGLLHDIGLKEMPPDLLKRPRAQWTHEEVQVYETHPFRAVKALQSLGDVPDDLISIVYEHHEDTAGQGYPRHIKGVRIHPLAKVVALANGFAELILKGVNNPSPRDALGALGYIERTLGQPYQKEAFRALQDLVQSKKATKAA